MSEKDINQHLDNNCVDAGSSKTKSVTVPKSVPKGKAITLAPIFGGTSSSKKKDAVSTPFKTPSSIHSGSTHKRRITETAAIHDHAGPSNKKAKIATANLTMTSRISAAAPLAERLRPQSLEEFVGQPQLTAHDSLLMGLIRNGSTGSMIFWGPPGCVSSFVQFIVDADFVT